MQLALQTATNGLTYTIRPENLESLLKTPVETEGTSEEIRKGISEGIYEETSEKTRERIFEDSRGC